MPATVRLIRQTRGFVTAIAGAGGFRPSYVSDILAGRRPPSERFWQALEVTETQYLSLLKTTLQAEIIERAKAK